IEQYFILLKLEKVKELISYGELALNEIAWKLGYSSVQHLSSQFKRVLGVSTRAFKTTILSGRKTIDQVGIDD
ncbi:MAG: helix-turn-helix domain-containing protein, partial [Moraxellaceae bacterium]